MIPKKKIVMIIPIKNLQLIFEGTKQGEIKMIIVEGIILIIDIQDRVLASIPKPYSLVLLSKKKIETKFIVLKTPFVNI